MSGTGWLTTNDVHHLFPRNFAHLEAGLTQLRDPQELRLEVDRVSFRNEDNGWTVFKGTPQTGGPPVTAVGHFTVINPGESYHLIGNWIQHRTFGPQFQIERSAPIRPTTEDGIVRYLSSGMIKGIGPKTAEKIVAHFHTEALNILDEQPHRILEVPTIGRKKGETIIEAWVENRAVHDVMMFLNGHGISPLFATRLYRLYGKETISIVSRDPYRLAHEVRGIGFISADRIAQQLGIAPDSPQRIRAAIVFLLNSASEKGHCYLSTEQLRSDLTSTLQLDPDVLRHKMLDSLSELNESGAIVSESVLDGSGNRDSAQYPMSLYLAESSVAHQLSELTARPVAVENDRVDGWLARYCEASGTQLSEEQLRAVKLSVQSRVFILTGGPGVGKTTTANAIIRLLKAMGRGVALCAPTGRAAQRLTEVAAVQAKTIHRLLEWQPREGTFARDEHSPLTAQAVICDEASMLDVKLAEALIRAVPKTAQLILIGDVDQLPSVGPGNVLRDLIDSGVVPYCRLGTIFRQAATSDIIRIAHTINRGDSPEFSASATTDCRFLEVDQPEQIRQVICEQVSTILPQFGWDPIRDVQILTPMNRGDLGTQMLNELLQEQLNPRKQGLPEYRRGQLRLRPQDKVIQISNNYDLGVFNGDIGIVQHAEGESGKLYVAFGERLVAYEPDQSLELRLAYGITIHKSQGSEFPVVVIPVSMQHYIMLQRNLIYTALTRAKKLAVFVGTKKALVHAVQNQNSLRRQTRLLQRLKEATGLH